MEEKTNLLSVSDVAKYLKVTPQYVRKLIAEEKLGAIRVGKQWVVEPKAIDHYVSEYNVIIEPDDHERKSDHLPDIVALSFFSGAMGLDIGLKNGGIEALLACEFNKYCRMTIDQNEPEMALIGDINKYSSEEILKMAKIPSDRKVDVIFGGPPCQAFSTAGARRAFDDDRGNVFLRYIQIVQEILPRYVIIENVRGLLSTPYPYKDISKPIKGGALCEIIDRLENAGYALTFELYNAANFGAPQIRERVVMIGKLNGDPVSYLSPTHDKEGRWGLEKWAVLRDAIGDLDPEKHHYIEFPESRLKYYRMLTEGQYWKDLPPDIQVEAMGRILELGGGKTGFYRRLNFSKPSPTLVTNPTMPATDLCHPTLDRPLSVEEYSRIQGFPDDWQICGPILEQYKQIGNAVPIKLGEAIARTIIADMRKEELPHYEGFPYSRYKNTSDVSWRKVMEQSIKKERIKQESEKNEQMTIDLSELK